MTPDQAQKLLHDTTPGPWRIETLSDQPAGCPEVTEFWVENEAQAYVAEKTVPTRRADTVEQDFNLIAAAPDMAETIATMTPEYDAIEQSPRDGSITGGGAFRTLEEATAWAAQAPYRTVRVRYVSWWKPLEDLQ